MIFKFIPLILVILGLIYLAKNKIHIKFKTFFKKGFKKLDNRFRASRFHAVSREPVKLIQQYPFVLNRIN